MKKVSFCYLIYLLFFLFLGCTDEINQIDDEAEGIVMIAKDFISADNSRTFIEITNDGGKFFWAADDTVGIFPNEGAQAYFPMTHGAGTNKSKFNGGGWALKPLSTYAAYYPFIKSMQFDKTSVPISYEGQIQNGNSSTAHLGKFDYMAAVASSPQSGYVNFNFEHLGCLVEVNIPQEKGLALQSVTFSTAEEEFAVKSKINLAASPVKTEALMKQKAMTISVKGIEVATTDTDTVTVYAMIPPLNLLNKELKVVCKFNVGEDKIWRLEGGNYQAGHAYSIIPKRQLKKTYIVKQPGQLPQLVSKLKNHINILKLIGDLNGDDIRFIREMLGRDVEGKETLGQLVDLDLSEARIVSGGGAYYTNGWPGPSFTSEHELGDYMFYDTKLIRISFPKDLTRIGNRTFQSTPLVEAIIPTTVKEVGPAAYNGCKLKKLYLPSSVTSLGEMAFSAEYNYPDVFIDCNIPNKKGYESIFRSSRFDTVTIGKHVESLGDYALSCKSVKSLVFESENRLKSIGVGAFAFHSDFYTMLIPGSIKSIGDYNFHLSSFREFGFIGHSLFLNIADDCLGFHLDNGDYMLYRYPPLKEDIQFTVPVYVNGISPGTFRNCQNIKEITISHNVHTLGRIAFCGCANLETITFETSDLTNLEDYDLFGSCFGTNEICKKLKSFKGNYCSKDNKCMVFNKVLVQYATGSLETSYTLPDEIDKIFEGAFLGSVNLKNIICHSPVPPELVDATGVPATFDDDNSLKKYTIYVPIEYLDLYRQTDGWKDMQIEPLY